MPSQTATLLVTDLVGSTELRARLGEDEADELHRLHDRLLYDIVGAHEGVVVKSLGDGVLASFAGAAQAVAAAVAIQQAADSHTRRNPDHALVLRAGLSAGDVTVEQDGDRVGIPVVEATRLCAIARAGQILAADIVRALTRGRGGHQFAPVGVIDLKGFPDPVAIVEIGWEPAPSAPLPFPKLLGTPDGLTFSGRASELELLVRAWKDATSGERRSVLVAGEPGVGKTRLAAELARVVHAAGGAVLYGRCEEHLGVPYEPFVEALGFFCDHTPAEDLGARLGRYAGELARLLPDLRDLVPGLDPPLRSDPETEQYRLFEAVASWLAAAAEPGGLLLVIDDLHWAPPPTLHLLAHGLRAAGPARLLVVANFRDTEVSPADPLGAVLADLRRQTGSERVALQGLSVDELTELLGNLPQGQTARSLAAALHEGTDGNPFFVGEILRDVSESALVKEALPVPDGVREVIVARVARLSTQTRELLGVASVLGREMELALLAGATGISVDGAVAAMDDALAARLMQETDVGAYRFVHDLVRSALYDSLSATRRARLHLRAADVLEQEGGEDAARLAHHLVACAPLGGGLRAAAACLAAGDRALAVLANAEAGDWYAEGLRFVTGEDGGKLHIDLLTGLGESQRRTGHAASRQTLLDAARLAADDHEVGRLARAVLANSRGISSVIGDVDEERLEVIDTALDLVGPAPSHDRAELLVLQATELLFAGDHERVLRAADEAGTIAAHLDDVAVRARVGLQRLWASLIPDRVPALVSEGADVVAFADGSGDPHLQTWSRAMWGCALLVIGDLGRARDQALETMAVADEAGQPGLRALAHSFYATTLDAVGEHEEAKRLTDFVPELGQRAGWPDAMLWYAGRMLLHWLFEGQPEIATAAATSTVTAYPRMAVGPSVLALGLAITGHGQELAGRLADVPSVLPRVPVDPFWLLNHSVYAAAQGFGVMDAEAAAATHKALLPYRSLHAAAGISTYLGPIEMALAVTARAMGDLEGALAHHESAAATAEACGAARARAFNGYQWAVSLLARDDPGDRRRGIEIAQETLAYCRAKGYATFVSKAEELLTSSAR